MQDKQDHPKTRQHWELVVVDGGQSCITFPSLQ